MEPRTEKRCPDCKEVLKIHMFAKNRGRRGGGLSSVCKACSVRRVMVWKKNRRETRVGS